MPAWLKKILTTIDKQTANKLLVVCDSTPVGTLSYEDDLYVFQYDKDCPEELKIKGLDNDVTKSRSLPTFFTTRIPSSTRPEIQEKMEQLNEDDCIEILGELSQKSAVSPYEFILKKVA